MARGRGSAFQVGEDVAATMANCSKALEGSVKEALQPVAREARKRFRAAAGPPTGGDRRYSRMGRYNHQGKLDVTVSVRKGFVFVGSKGPWMIAEDGTVPHRVNHPGTRRSQGRRAWSLTEAPLLADAETSVPKVIGDAVEEAFGG